MDPARYAVWVLVLQVAAYLAFLDLGLQTAVGRYIAFAEEKGDLEWRDAIFSTAVAGLSLAAAIGALLIVGAVALTPFIFPKVPAPLVSQMRLMLLIVGFTTALSLPASACNGVFTGRQRYEVMILTVTCGKILSAIGLIIAALAGASLICMALIYSGINLVSYAIQVAAKQYFAPDICFRPSLITRACVRELSQYCLSLTVWSIGILLITGFDLILVSRYQFSDVAVYSAASVLITFLGGFQTSIFNVIMPHSATLHAAGDARGLGDLLRKSTKLGTTLILLTGLPLIVLAPQILGIWLGPSFVASGTWILIILTVGNMLRLTWVPYASILVGTGQQSLVVIGPLSEGISNLVLSILLGVRFGAMGVALGTLFGAIIGVLVTVFYGIRKTRSMIDASCSDFIAQVIMTALVCSPAFLVAWPFAHLIRSSAELFWRAALAVSMATCLILVFKSRSSQKRMEL